MAYVPRPPALMAYAHCGLVWARNTRRCYCSPSCNVRASYARNGRARAARPAPAPSPVPVSVSLPVVGPVPPGRPVYPVPPQVLALVLLAAAALAEAVARPTPTPRTRLEGLARQMAHDLAQPHRPRPRLTGAGAAPPVRSDATQAGRGGPGR